MPPTHLTPTAGRNGPALLVQMVDPGGQAVGEARRNSIALQATLNIALKAPAAPATFIVRGTVRLSTSERLADATVQIVVWDRVGDDPLVSTRFSAEEFRSPTAEVQGPDLIVRVFNEHGLLLATSLSEGALGAGFPHNSGSPKTIMIKLANESIIPQ